MVGDLLPPNRYNECLGPSSCRQGRSPDARVTALLPPAQSTSDDPASVLGGVDRGRLTVPVWAAAFYFPEFFL